MEKAEAGLDARLLSEGEKSKIKSQEAGVMLVAAKCGVWMSMCVVFGCYIATLVAVPVPSLQKFKEELLLKMIDTPFGLGGGILLLFGVPALILAILAIISLETSSRTAASNKPKVRGRSSLKNTPVVTKGIMGIISAAELLWILFFLSIFIWIMANYMSRDFKIAETQKLKPFESVWGKKLKYTGLHLGFIGIVCLSLLFLPVSRGSVLLRLIDMPFEHAIKYHVWLGHFMMALFTLHGLSYSIAWYFEGRLYKLLEWAPHKITNLAGVIALLAGITMWVTSIGWVRQKYFEIFFYTHQLYIVFVIFMAFHLGDFISNVVFGGLFLFTVDRFLRFCQSRSSVGVLSTKLLQCGTFELVIAKTPGLQYHALSFIFLNAPSISALQWHPFSVSSSPYDADHWLKVLIKPHGQWTHQLQDVVTAAVKPRPSLCTMKTAVEGPYGHESNYYLRYETLVLVAGGIGISPFVAILRDLLHRYQREQPNLPSTVTLIWAVQKSEELQILDLVSASMICPDYKLKFNLHVHVYVTQEGIPVKLDNNLETLDSEQQEPVQGSCILASLTNSEASKHPMSILVGTGNNLWIMACLLASLLGYILITILMNHFLVKPTDMKSVEAEDLDTDFPFWVKGLLNIISMVLGILIFGGSVIALWSHYKDSCKGIRKVDKESTHLLSESDDDSSTVANESGDMLLHPSNTHFGHRPDLREYFEGCAKQQRPGTNVGVLVCGPLSLQSSVADICRGFNVAKNRFFEVYFSYHSVSFDL